MSLELEIFYFTLNNFFNNSGIQIVIFGLRKLSQKKNKFNLTSKKDMDPNQPLSAKRNPIDVEPFTYQSTQQEGLYAVGPLAGDNFVRFVQGGALAVASSLLRKEARKPP